MTLGLSSAALLTSPGVEVLNAFGQDKFKNQGKSGFYLKTEKKSLPDSDQPLNDRSAIALFEQYCLRASSVLAVDSSEAYSGEVSLAPSHASSYSPSRLCSFASFADYLSELSAKAYSLPASGVFTSGFGPRWSRHHSGIDIANHIGTAIRASRSGRVVFSGFLGAYGLMIEIEHPDGYRTRYAHCNESFVQVGDIVGKSDLIARMGNTGRSTGPHLHFEIRTPKNVALDPASYLQGLVINEEIGV